ncbi:MAG TPA: DegT/DnrJ/EryC1/StrS family aminotransferase [Gemmatimonadaceae bacterium]|nr:DegT/DnrJ/EryC1/StrS family aminotransferase [Gemmatimonadaceae bacterium]
MTWFQEPPVYSPVELRTLLLSAGSLLQGGESAHGIVAAELERRYNARGSVLTESGTAALVLALRMCVPRGGTVAYPGYGCIDLSAAAIRAGVRVRLYDLDPVTLSPDLASLSRTIKRGVDAIVVAHFYGYPADVRGVRELAANAGVPVIEDAAQAAGGTLDGILLGAHADISILSFGRGKGTTAGSGGALLLRGKASANRVGQNGFHLDQMQQGGYELAALGAQWLLARPSLYRVPASIPGLRLGEMVYKPAAEPRSMSRVSASVLSGALRLEGAEVGRRRTNAKRLIESVGEGSRLIPVHAISGGEPGYLRLALLDRAGDTVARESLGAVRGYPMTLDQHVQLQPLLVSNERAGSGSVQLRDRLFTVPTHSRVRDVDIARLVDWLNE